MSDESELIDVEQIAELDKLFDIWERKPIETDEDLIELSEIFDDDE